jgi:hypothetical protein
MKKKYVAISTSIFFSVDSKSNYLPVPLMIVRRFSINKHLSQSYDLEKHRSLPFFKYQLNEVYQFASWYTCGHDVTLKTHNLYLLYLKT